jgi:hypothetical protein
MTTMFRIVFRISPRLAAAWSRWAYARESATVAKANAKHPGPRVTITSRRG